MRQQGGECPIAFGAEFLVADWEFGLIETGRSGLFNGYFVRVSSGDCEWLGSDPHSLRRALRLAAVACQRDGYTLGVVGLSDRFQESGLSYNTGYGWVEGAPAKAWEPTSIMAPSPDETEA